MRAAAWALVVAAVVVSSTAVAGPSTKKKAKKLRAAVVLVIDRSGSMQGPKLDAALRAAVAAGASLEKADRIAVVAFDSEAHLPVPLQKAGDAKALADGVATIKAGGGTNVFTGIAKANEVLSGTAAKRRHVIVLSDGEAPYDGIEELATQMHADGITISTVAVAGADMNLLELIAKAGGGRTYDVKDLDTLSQVFADETKAGTN